MASTSTRKKTRSRGAPAPRRVADMTTDEFREMLDALIEEKLAQLGGVPGLAAKPEITAEMRQRALAVSGRFHSGHTDISEDHDRYLDASYRE